MIRSLSITLFLLILHPGKLIAQSIEKIFCGTVPDYTLEWSFHSDNSYSCVEGSFYTGKYKIVGDTIVIVSSFNRLGEQDDRFLKDKFIIDSSGWLVSIWTSSAFRPRSDSFYCGPIAKRHIKYPEINTRDSALKSLVWKMLMETFRNKKFTDLFPASCDTITISNYYFLNNTTQPTLTDNNRAFVFQRGDALVQIDVVNVNEDTVEFYFSFDKKSKGGYSRFVIKNGKWEAEWINAWSGDPLR